MLKNMSTNVDHKTMDKKLLLKPIKSRVKKDFSQSYKEYLNPIKYNACLDIAETISYANQFIGFCSDGQYLRRCLEYLSIVVQNKESVMSTTSGQIIGKKWRSQAELVRPENFDICFCVISDCYS